VIDLTQQIPSIRRDTSRIGTVWLARAEGIGTTTTLLRWSKRLLVERTACFGSRPHYLWCRSEGRRAHILQCALIIGSFCPTGSSDYDLIRRHEQYTQALPRQASFKKLQGAFCLVAPHVFQQLFLVGVILPSILFTRVRPFFLTSCGSRVGALSSSSRDSDKRQRTELLIFFFQRETFHRCP